MTAHAAMYQRYVADRRKCDMAGMTRTDLGAAVLFEAHAAKQDDFLQFTSLTPANADAFIAEVVAQIQKSGRGLEWKTYGFDTPSDLVARLQRAGFEPDDEESFMVYTLPKTAPQVSMSDADWRIEQVRDLRGIADIVDLQERTWNRVFPWLYDRLSADFVSGAQQFYCAYAGDAPIGCGYIEYILGSQFPELHGGAVVPEYRGRGIYAALYKARFADAIARGFEFIAVDCTSMSHPILEKIGFQWVCPTRPMRWARAA